MSRHRKRRLPDGPFYRDLGRNLRVARGAAGKSQMDAAAHIDVTFQQLQKYENGTNRIPLDRLVNLAAYFEVPLSQFVAPSDGDSEFRALAEKLTAKEFHALMEAWGAIKDRQTRAALLNLAKCMAALSR